MDDGLGEYGTTEKVIEMKRLNPSLVAAGLAVGLGLNASADDLAWKYEGEHPADEVAVVTTDASALTVSPTVGAKGSEEEIDAQWSCSSFLDGLTYRFKRFFAFFVK